jgi:hypothetical protein
MRNPVTIISLGLIFVILALFLLPCAYNFEPQIRQRLNQAAAELGVELSVDRVEIRFLPRPNLRLRNIKVNQRLGAPAFKSLEIEKLRIELSLLGLISGNYEPSRLRVHEMDLSFEVETLAPALTDVFTTGLDFDVQFENSVIRYQLDQVRQPLVLADVSGTVTAGGLLAPSTTSLSFRYGDEVFSLELKTDDPSSVKMPINFNLSGAGNKISFDGFVEQGEQKQINGEFLLKSQNALPLFLSSFGLATQIYISPTMELSGLIFADPTSVQTDKLQLRALNQEMSLRLSYLFSKDRETQADKVFFRLSADEFELAGLRWRTGVARKGSGGTQPIEMREVRDNFGRLSAFFPVLPVVEASLRIDNARFNDKAVKNIRASVDRTEDGIYLNRLSADLPFTSSLLASGAISLDTSQPSFTGHASVQSQRTKEFIPWLISGFGVPLGSWSERLDATNIQRISFASDVDYQTNFFALSNLTGQVDGKEQFGALVFDNREAPRVDINWRAPHFDLADLGLLKNVPEANKNNMQIASLPLNAMLMDVFDYLEDQPKFNIYVTSDDFNAGVIRLGAVSTKFSVDADRLDLAYFEASNYNASAWRGSARLAHTNELVYGDIKLSTVTGQAGQVLQPLQSFASPLAIQYDQALSAEFDWKIANPRLKTLKASRFKSKFTMGDMQGAFSFDSGTRDFNLLGKDTSANLKVEGPAKDLFSLIGANPPKEGLGEAVLNIGLVSADNMSANILGDLKTQGDIFMAAGNLRDMGVGRQLQGKLDFQLSDVSDYFMGDQSPARIAIGGKTERGHRAETAFDLNLDVEAQFKWTPSLLSFSNLNGEFASASIKGEGVVDLTKTRKDLSANILIDGLDTHKFMPSYNDGWSRERISWSLLGLTDASLELTLLNLRFGVESIDRVRGRLRLVDGVLEGRGLRADFAGGSMEFEVFAEGGSLLPSFQFDGALRDARFDAIGAALFEQTPISAPLSIRLSVKGRGRSADEFMRSLTGQGAVEFAEGQLNFIDVSRLSLGEERASGEADIADPLSARDALNAVSGSTPIGRALGIIEVKNGVINVVNGEIILRPTYPIIPIDISIDMPNYSLSLDMAFEPSLDDDRVYRLALTGPLNAPSLLFGLEDRSSLPEDQTLPR